MSFRKFQCDSGSSSPFFDYVIVTKPVSDSEFCQNAERKSVNRDSAPQDSADRDSRLKIQWTGTRRTGVQRLRIQRTGIRRTEIRRTGILSGHENAQAPLFAASAREQSVSCFLCLKERSGKITVTGVRKKSDNGLPLIFRSLCKLGSGKECGTG